MSEVYPENSDPVTITGCTIPTPEGVTYTPWSNGYAVGFKATHNDGRVEYLYLNPSSDTDDGQPNIFIYHGTTPDMEDARWSCFIDLFDTAAQPTT